SISPGMIHCPAASITCTLRRSSGVTSGGSAPTLLILLPSMTIASLRAAGLPEPSISVPLRITRVFGAALMGELQVYCRSSLDRRRDSGQSIPGVIASGAKQSRRKSLRLQSRRPHQFAPLAALVLDELRRVRRALVAADDRLEVGQALAHVGLLERPIHRGVEPGDDLGRRPRWRADRVPGVGRDRQADLGER